MRLYNTASGQKEELKTLKPHEVNMYVCGPTTYNYIHLGNARPLVVFDTVRRYLEYRGYKVNYVQNFTDVDDKIINRALQERTDPIELAERYIEEYFKDADQLGIRRAQVHPRVSEHIPDIIAAIEKLILTGHAYEVGGDVYYRVRSFPDYGKLSGRSLDDMLAGARIEIDERKKDPGDFALWKAAKPGEPFWESPWGQGRPGWHIECSVMSIRYLGETLDIHGGGNDLIFPHHENEVAQSEALTGKPFVRYWLHNGFITVNKEKMSKSLGNFFLLRDILKMFPADVVRFYLIATHYRSPLDFDDTKLEEARRALNRLRNTLILMDEFVAEMDGSPVGLSTAGKNLTATVNLLESKFAEAMDDDFNTARAIGYLFEISHAVNLFIAEQDRNEAGNQQAVYQAGIIFRQLISLLGIEQHKNDDYEDDLIDEVLGIIARIRRQARKEKDFALADSIRDYLRRLEVNVEDLESGSRFRYEQAPPLETLLDKLLELRTRFREQKMYDKADIIRDSLQETGIILEDTSEGVRWKLVNV